MKRRATVAIGLALGLAGCGSSRPGSTPSAPSPVVQATPQPPPQPTYTLSGLVFIETPTGRVRLEGARIAEANSHSGANCAIRFAAASSSSSAGAIERRRSTPGSTAGCSAAQPLGHRRL